MQVNQYIKDTFGFEGSFLKWIAVGLAGWALFISLVFVLAIKFLNFQRRLASITNVCIHWEKQTTVL